MSLSAFAVMLSSRKYYPRAALFYADATMAVLEFY